MSPHFGHGRNSSLVGGCARWMSSEDAPVTILVKQKLYVGYNLLVPPRQQIVYMSPVRRSFSGRLKVIDDEVVHLRVRETVVFFSPVGSVS